MTRIQIIDSHTGGEPTRTVVGGGPDLGSGSLAGRLEVFREKHDAFRRAVVTEPRGSDVLVGALLVEPVDKSCVTGVIYFDNVTYLGMCGHGTIGVVSTLSYMGRIQPGEHRIETPVGIVTVVLHKDGSVSVTNIPAVRKAKGVNIHCPGIGNISGDVAWGGNWFYIVDQHGLQLELGNIDQLTSFTWSLRQAVNKQGFPEVDHIVLLAPSNVKEVHARNYVLCPGKAYDRSPCGTGTSAHLACLAADGLLAEGAELVVESIVGSRFTGSFRWADRTAGKVIPTITGTAFVMGEGTLLIDAHDPFRWGIV